jgi:hypothetical protein
MVGCAATNTKEQAMPDWASHTQRVTCDGILGRFQRTPLLLTKWDSSDYDAPSTDLLNLLADEDAPKVAGTEPLGLELLDSGTSLRITITGHSWVDLASRCDSDGAVSISRRQEGQSEATALEHQLTVLTLWRDEDGSLVVRRRFKSKGLGFLLIPFREDVSQWLKYESAR